VPDSIWSAIGRKISLAMSLHGVARRPVLAGFLVVLLVEAADQLLEDRAHAVVVEPGCFIAVAVLQDRFGLRLMWREELLDQRAERVGLGERGIWLRNSKLSRMSCTFGEKPSR
jgi:hypothetical protein